MSTKTTLKRIALVAVSALGFGMLSVVPSSAHSDSYRFTTGVTPNTSHVTVVLGTNESSSAGIFWVDVANETNASASPTARGLIAGYETMTVSVLEAPGATAGISRAPLTSDLRIRPVLITESGSTTNGYLRIVQREVDTFATSVVLDSTSEVDFFSGSTFVADAANATGPTARYAFAVRSITSGATDAGYYKLRIRTQTHDSQIIDKFVSVRFVSSIQDAGATLTIASAGRVIQGESLTYTTNNYIQATLRDPNSGRVQMGIDLNSPAAADSRAVTALAPSLNANFTDSDGVVIPTTLTVADTGMAGYDYVASSSAGSYADATAATRYRGYSAQLDGVYGIYTPTGVNVGAVGDSTTNLIRVRVNTTNVSATAAITTLGARPTGLTYAGLKISASGILAADAESVSVTAAAAATKTYKLPLSVKSVTLTIDVDQANTAMTTRTTWTNNFASSDVSPASTTTESTLTNSSGVITRTITNNSPVDAATATVLITGFQNNNQITVTLKWEAPLATTINVVEPVANVHTALKGTTNFKVSVQDQFGNFVSGAKLQPSIPGTTDSNYSSTRTFAAITTDSTGVASFSLTDALAVNDGSDTVRFASIDNSSATAATYTVTYKTTVKTVSSYLLYYNDDWNATGTSVATSITSAGILDQNGTSGDLAYGINISKSLSSFNDSRDDALAAVRIRALDASGNAATGAQVTVTSATGGWLLDAVGLPTTSRTFGVPTSGDIVFDVLATAPGALRFTVTSGAATTSFLLQATQPTSTAVRNVAITGAATGTANGEGVPMTVTVTDRYGNPVSNVLLTLTASGVGSFMGGATTQSYTTDATGKYTFLATSSVAAGGSATYQATIATAGSDALSTAGYYNQTTEVDSTLKAGNTSASSAVTFAAGQSAAQSAAEAATDAANEAIDAANAATDAANLAAEAADAATVAAEEARDAADAATAAVEELATQVATLMAALKAQITTLANTVAKIAKKVKA